RYGDASPVAIKALQTLEDVVRICGSIPNTTLKSDDEIANGRRAIDARLEELKPIQGVAVHRLTLMLQYAAKDLEIQHLRATKADKNQIRAKAGELQQFLQQHADE